MFNDSNAANQMYCLVDCSRGHNNCWYRLYNSRYVLGNPDVKPLPNFNGYLDQQIDALITEIKNKSQHDQLISYQVQKISPSITSSESKESKMPLKTAILLRI